MKKKFLTLFAALCTSLSLWANGTEINGIYYILSGDSAIVTYGSYSGVITIPSSVTYSGASYRVTTVGEGAFINCPTLTSITIGNSVTSIGDNAFAECTGLTSIAIPNSVTSIGYSAFYDCTGLTSVTIGSSLTSIEYFTFYGCTSLTKVTWNAKNCTNFGTTVGGVYGVYYSAFYGVASQITSFVLGNSVQSIPDHCCSGMSKLSSITIPSSVTSIGEEAFRNCKGLTSITIPSSVTSIGRYAFAGCTGINTITIPSSVKSIEDYTFSSCTGITSISIPNYVTSIGYNAFEGCTGLKSITIPSSVTSIESYAFDGCTGLTKVVWNAKNCSSPSSYSYAPFYGVASQITSFVFGNSVQSIPAYCCSGMSKLSSITIPSSVTSIGKATFYGCTGFTSITIPSSITSIGEETFRSCSGLTSITCYATTPPTCGSNCFYNVDKTIPIYVPASSVSLYKAADQWKYFTNILGIGTGVEEIFNNAASDTRVLIDGKVYIRRGNSLYDANGRKL